MENQQADLLATLRFQENLLRLTQGLEGSAAKPEPELRSPVSEFVKIARKSSLSA